MRRPQEFAPSFVWFWHFLSKHQNNKEEGAIYCSLLRIAVLYQITIFNTCIKWDSFFLFSGCNIDPAKASVKKSECPIKLCKVQVFWESHKNFRHPLYGFDIFLENIKTIRRKVQFFVAFSEKVYFTKLVFLIHSSNKILFSSFRLYYQSRQCQCEEKWVSN